MGKVIDVEFRATDRGRWCVRCDEPFPEGTAMCPRCGGDLSSAARHRAETAARARRQVRKWVATGAGLTLLVVGALLWLFFGGGVAHGDEKPVEPTTSSAAPPPPKRAKKEKVATVAPQQHPPDAGVPPEAAGDGPLPGARPVRVRLLDGSSVVGTVHAEEIATLVIDCSLGQLSIPRARISTIAYDAAAGIGSKRAPVQQLDDEDKPTKKRATTQP
ncbi:MAG TPA: hypothetical protein VN947_22265 [Polyangia bacterium]|nr:hypothetical protein [Polyangia bacterium]